MTIGFQEIVALAIVVVIVGAVVFRRLRARRRSKQTGEASVKVDEISRRR